MSLWCNILSFFSTLSEFQCNPSPNTCQVTQVLFLRWLSSNSLHFRVLISSALQSQLPPGICSYCQVIFSCCHYTQWRITFKWVFLYFHRFSLLAALSVRHIITIKASRLLLPYYILVVSTVHVPLMHFFYFGPLFLICSVFFCNVRAI